MKRMRWMDAGSWRQGLFRGALGAVLLVGPGCKEEAPAPALTSLAPEPLPRIEDSGGASTVLPITPHGEKLPKDAEVFPLSAQTLEGGELLKRAEQMSAETSVVLRPDADVYLMQVAPLFSVLADRGSKVWLAHPEGDFGYRLMLFDEAAYQHWIDLPEPGRLRVIMRGDGYELATSVGKLPGPDRNGPSVPLRQGRHDLGRLRLAFEALLDRFSTEDMICWVPSFGMELQTVARSLAATFEDDGDSMLERQCLVFPRRK